METTNEQPRCPLCRQPFQSDVDGGILCSQCRTDAAIELQRAPQPQVNGNGARKPWWRVW